MKKTSLITFFIFIITILLFTTGCSGSSSNDKETPSTKSKTLTVDQILEKASKKQQIEDDQKSAENFLRIAIDDLGIAYDNYGYESNISNNVAIVNYPNQFTGISAMYSKNEFLDSHEIEFIIPENKNIEVFVPKTLESKGFVEDDQTTWVGIGEMRGYVWESSLDSYTGFCWDSKTTIEIKIDETYHIFINKKF